MINVGDKLSHDRWEVAEPYLAGNGRNFTYFIVEDRDVLGRPALLKTVRKSDLPSEPLYRWRCDALRSEIKTASMLTCPFVPEPLDAEFRPGHDPFVVYSLIGRAERNYLLREKLQLHGFITRPRGKPQGNFEEGWRQIETISRYLHDLLKATDELWAAGFVHPNLNPDHLFLLRDDVLRITGISAVCKVENGGVPATAPGLRNLSIGYQSRDQYRVAQAAVRNPEAVKDMDPLSAERLRWHTYAVLTVDLLWGRDLREFCANRGYSYLQANDVLQKEVRRDFPSFFSTAPKQERQRESWEAMQPSRDELWDTLSEILSSNQKLPPNLSARFHRLWEDLAWSDYVNLLPVHTGEFAWRRDRNWSHEGHRPRQWPVVRDGSVTEYVVVSEEQPQEGKTGRRFARYEVVSAADPARARLGMQKMYLRTAPIRRHYFLPGDIIPGVAEVGERNLQNGRTIPKIDIQTADWMDPEQARLKPAEGQRMRALSLGRRFTTLETTPGPIPWATIEVDGNLQTYPIRPASPKQSYIVFPAAGRFFNAEFRENSRHGFGVVPADAPTLDKLHGRKQEVVVRDVEENNMLFFDLQVNDDYLVTCTLPAKKWRGEVVRGGRIPVKVVLVNNEWIETVWDVDQVPQARAGQEYTGHVERIDPERTRIWVRFGQEGHLGLLNREYAGVIPWGVPVESWGPGSEVRVRVRGNLPERRYALEMVARDLPKVEELLPPKARVTARVVGHGRDVDVYVEDAAGRVGVVGKIRRFHLNPAQLQNLPAAFPLGQSVAVVVEEIDPRTGRVLLAPA